MAVIVYNAENIGNAYAPSLNRALQVLYAQSGIKPVIRTPYGGLRTTAEQKRINPALPGSRSDHVKGRAVDIDNQRAIRNKIGSAKFEATLRRYGWRNQTIDGFAFPSEPWHFANHLTGSALARVVGDPNPYREVYYDPSTRRFWLIGAGTLKLWNTRSKTLARIWSGRFGYSGNATYAQIMAADAALRVKYPNGK